MADEENKKTDGAQSGPQVEFNTGGAQPNGDASDQPLAGMLAQYVKDLSFENPNAPQIFQSLQNAKPNVKVSVNVAARQVAQDAFEVELKLEASSSADEQSVYVVELLYAGLFQLRNIPEDAMQPFMLVEAPRLLFPFARRIISDAVRDGGYPPLTLDPIDFAALYQERIARADGSPVQPTATA